MNRFFEFTSSRENLSKRIENYTSALYSVPTTQQHKVFQFFTNSFLVLLLVLSTYIHSNRENCSI